MPPRQRPVIRHCPLCRIAMQGSRSRDGLPYFDTYECLTCHTVITETPAAPPPGRTPDRAE